ncbi:glycerophosphodiester phosphodiesterase family protein [Nocardia carnea]|uniref:glycerophosphodiester phosphodiesterase family protein n=1 Tax=Nocardia carnea TaxID=37328 RepID=UPI002458A43B|nr:glycerophosphodiester phosphodiesterase family protein [Nocardia carnea]
MRPSLLLATTAVCVAGVLAPSAAQASPPLDFDLQAHRGGRALTVENMLPTFAKALEVGVGTLELDVAITRDGREVVTHDSRIDPGKCVDKGLAHPEDQQFPYAGKLVKELTFEQVRTLDCGSITQADYPGQRSAPGAPMATLTEVFELVRERGAKTVAFSIELKTDPAGGDTRPARDFVDRVVSVVAQAGVHDRVKIQSFDWGAL